MGAQTDIVLRELLDLGFELPETETRGFAMHERIAGRFVKKAIEIEAEPAEERTEIETLEGAMVADPGDWIITGVQGERYPCKPDIFFATYDRVVD